VSLACGAKPAPGGNCKYPGRFVCADQTTALYCNAGIFEAVPCRGARGCTGGDVAPMCDDRTATEGERCMPGGRACGADGARGLSCEGGKWVAWRACKGARGCVATHDRVECDATRADVGDACAADDAFACTTDGAALLACRAGRMQITRSCRGSAGCSVELGSHETECDDSVGREGDPCGPSGMRTCSEDRKRELVCDGATLRAAAECTRRGGCAPQVGAAPLCVEAREAGARDAGARDAGAR